MQGIKLHHLVEGSVASTGHNVSSVIVTIILTASPRPTDPNTEMLQEALTSTRRVLYPRNSPQATLHVLFDGVKNGTAEAVAAAYRAKRSWADIHVPATFDGSVVHSESWLHKRGLLAFFLNHQAHARRATPLLFVLEEDSGVMAPISVSIVHRALLVWARPHAPQPPCASAAVQAQQQRVEHVRLNWYDDCVVPRGSNDTFMTRAVPGNSVQRMHVFDYPCTRHRCSSLLHRTFFWSDRPHWATWGHYLRVLARTAHGGKGTLETLLERESGGFAASSPGAECRSSGCWVYGARGEMRRDLHLSTSRSYNRDV